jgi:hypothetical protein
LTADGRAEVLRSGEIRVVNGDGRLGQCTPIPIRGTCIF